MKAVRYLRGGGALSLIIVLGWLAGCAPLPPPAPVAPPVAPPQVQPPAAPPAAGLPKVQDSRLARLDAVGQQEVAAGHTPGAVIFVGQGGKIIYHKAFGSRTLTPYVQPMTEDTIFDLASLTKVMATSTAIMQLADAGRLQLDAPAAKYWPEFGAGGKRGITLRQLMTHTSGLRAEVSSRGRWSGYDGALAAIAADQPVKAPGSSFHYSDANFIALGEIVHRVSGQPLEVYCAQKIFGPLGLRDTRFRPRGGEQMRIAPTDLRWGEVHDPTAYRMGGVAGNAGVFSTADDLSVFVQMLLDGGISRGRRILSAAAVAALIKPQGVPGSSTRRGLGWDLCSPYSRVFDCAFPAGSFGHTGYTGTSIWADPRSKTFLIILTNRLHPNGRGNVRTLRAKAAAAVAAGLHLGPPARMASWKPTGPEEFDPGYGASDTADRVRPGIEVLAAEGFAPLRGKNIGVITNHTAVTRDGQPVLKLLRCAPGVKVRALFSPEHGLSGQLDESIASGTDPSTGLPVYSLYGKHKKPTAGMLKGLDALVYDIQDVGARFYTYITTMGYAMEAAAAAGLDFYVLDRPNPLTAASVQGPVLEADLKSFIGYYPLPVRYGLTVGELAHLFNRERHIGVKLHVVRMTGYRRDAWFDQTGLPWVNPSPNIRSLTQAILYSGVGLVEAANVSVGRGTPTPFEVVGAPWISGGELARYLTQRQVPGVTFESVSFVPTSGPFRGQRCAGVRLRLTRREALDVPALGVELAGALNRLYPGKFQCGNTLGMIGSRRTLTAIRCNTDPQAICRGWQRDLEAFQRVRARYLLY